MLNCDDIILSRKYLTYSLPSQPLIWNNLIEHKIFGTLRAEESYNLKNGYIGSEILQKVGNFPLKILTFAKRNFI